MNSNMTVKKGATLTANTHDGKQSATSIPKKHEGQPITTLIAKADD
jgi:hypothetical protein